MINDTSQIPHLQCPQTNSLLLQPLLFHPQHINTWPCHQEMSRPLVRSFLEHPEQPERTMTWHCQTRSIFTRWNLAIWWDKSYRDQVRTPNGVPKTTVVERERWHYSWF